MHIYTYYLLWYWPFFFKAIQTTFRLEEITNSSSSWRMKGRGGLQLCKHWTLLNKATQSWRKNWPTRSTLGKVLTRLWKGHKDRPRTKGNSYVRPMTSWLLLRSNWQPLRNNWRKPKGSKTKRKKQRLRRKRQKPRLRKKKMRPSSTAMTSMWLRPRIPSRQRSPLYAKPTMLRLGKKPSIELGLILLPSWGGRKMFSSLQPYELQAFLLIKRK